MIALPDSYLRAVRALPDDDGPRLCAADWWDEQGAAERAEFVRVQCELARRYPGWSGEPAPDSLGAGGPYAELRRRERELLAGSRGKWFDFPITWHVGIDPVPVGAHGFQYRRGFFEVAALTAADFLACADALTAACPLRQVRLTTWPEAGFGDDSLPGDRHYRRQGWLVGRSFREWFVCRPGGRWVPECRDPLVRRGLRISASCYITLELLAAEFPGIDFELPTDGAPVLADPRTLIRGALP
jgi:uncharacterized protein (TIGR02996 family)